MDENVVDGQNRVNTVTSRDITAAIARGSSRRMRFGAVAVGAGRAVAVIGRPRR